jgi:PiT family inorganic phosphate transporter
VSFFHGSNDGQKGVGLFMIVLMIFLPTQFALHKSFDAEAVLTTLNKVEVTVKATEARIGENEAAEEVVESIEKLKDLFDPSLFHTFSVQFLNVV